MNKVLIAALAALVAASANAQIVYSNNPSPGDYFVGNVGGIGQAVGSSGWYYNNVRNGATVGINQDYARSGNGSVHFSVASGSKADIEYLAGSGINVLGTYYPTSSLGKLSDLSSVSFDWYRDSASTVAAHFHTGARVYIDADANPITTDDLGYLIYERIYNGSNVAVENQWVSDGIGLSTKLWTSGELGGPANGFNNTLQDFIDGAVSGISGNSAIVGFSFGIGSGWTGQTEMALDNVSWTINGVTTSNNFEVNPVPEPATMTALALGGLALLRRKKR